MGIIHNLQSPTDDNDKWKILDIQYENAVRSIIIIIIISQKDTS